MKAELKNFDIVGMNGEWFSPDHTEYFGALLDLVIGPLDSEGGDNFSAIVCTPLWFADNVLSPKPIHETHEIHSRPLFGRHHLFVQSFDEHIIRETIEQFIAAQTGDDWRSLALRLSRELAWEFEDYASFNE
ncbi:Imm8 family immunity protein [Rhizobium tumorigenes]|uniref:Imm8 family immunity protein n=1 Tax=Rhizobium tumorigenes TaxID=2041385 RepID=A0AAF1KSJ3_9HYPH|nr:Imm8 family immunity protein [Rhizobium tumorigenes]WFR97613.1 Imm8 family immunity protein [Rhizobium tumorigenes]